MSMTQPTGKDKRSKLPRWLRPPDPNEVILIFAAGEDVQVPDYLEQALDKFDQEMQSKMEPGTEGICLIMCEVYTRR